MSRTIPMKGLKELDRYLSALPMQMQKAAIRQALTAAAKPVRDEARRQAPKGSGKMARAIKTGSPRQNQDGSFSVSVRLDPKGNDHAYLGLFFEYGVKPHLIARKAAKRGPAGLKAAVSKGEKVGGAMKIGDRFVSGVITHPGFGAKPFMRPALDFMADEAVKAFAAKIREFIEGKTGFVAPNEMDEAA